jgi:uncharacterized membrane protein YphA (DoxX/SURF4 family)
MTKDAVSAHNARLPLLQRTLLFILRVAIGWHFLYEGLVKLQSPDWTSAAYLAESRWILSGVFRWIAVHPAAIRIVDFLNVWGLILIGLGLLLGLFTRAASIAGIFLLVLYYIARPPFVGIASSPMAEGNYLIVDKNLVELIALAVLAAFAGRSSTRLHRILAGLAGKLRRRPRPQAGSIDQAQFQERSRSAATSLSRRQLIRTLASVPFLGGFVFAVLKKRGWESYEEKHLLAATGGKVDTVTSATIKTFRFSTLKELKGSVPRGRIGKLELSRLFLGGNLIGGWAHARDLIYVSHLVKTYHTDQKIFETFRLAEQCGINTILTNPQLARVINAYWRREGGKIQFISDCGYKEDIIEGVKISLDAGAHACYAHGGIADTLAEEGKVDVIAGFLDLVRQNGLPAGIGGHKLETIKACAEKGLKPDFWVKTLHQVDYWSAKPAEECDNIWCLNPEETIDYMSRLDEPWIAYKILAAGAIHPKDGFKHAFQHGADFICVGMYDFQIVEDVNIALDVLAQPLERKRRWLT